MHKPPLVMHLLAHRASALAQDLAERLMERFLEPPASGGLRIPVFFTPKRTDYHPPALNSPGGLSLDEAEHTLVVLLSDGRMLATAGPDAAGAQWSQFCADLLGAAPAGQSPHHVLPVAVTEQGLGIAPEINTLKAFCDQSGSLREQHASKEQALAKISLVLATVAIQLLQKGETGTTQPAQLKAPVRLFLSHAKADTKDDRSDPAQAVLQAATELPVEQWFDSAKILPGERFAGAIRKGVVESTVTIAFYTDHYNSRPWCRREVLEAKATGAAVLVVNALQTGEPRLFPYLGNVPSIRWSFDDPALSIQRTIDRAIRENLRYQHNLKLLERQIPGGFRVLPSHPEALTLANHPTPANAAQAFLYPDPPLGQEEIEVLRQLRPEATFHTPLTHLMAQHRRTQVQTIAVSISDSDDIEELGLSPRHLETLTDEIHLYLLAAGLQIAYGGALKRKDLQHGSSFTTRLFELVRTHRPNYDPHGSLKPILNYGPWPLHLDYTRDDYQLFAPNGPAQFIPCPSPFPLQKDEDIFPIPPQGWRLTPDTPYKRYAWARGLSVMREKITQDTQGRLVIGGRMKGFQGLVPGVFEEAWMSIKEGKTLFVVGGFGGAAGAVCDLLQGNSREDLSEARMEARVPDYRAAVACFASEGQAFCSAAEMADQIKREASAGVAGVLRNGLTDEENRTLFKTTDPQRVAEQVLAGLRRLDPPQGDG